ncbi:tetratricopeptide repeat protein [Robiginitalea sp. SC105]|uniref:tetratricopeptide repeat protein n=1 Tax=Robiginitalea sp. SC105 TaxID=2762332 RepID=UPI00163ADBFB|nr:tetratricopeptide repeat protein [Robiginitalea sp. SC105]MBC2839668.1 tetratricopeptide repeat protein [Robiginitalea sp. SC105]
MSNFWDELKRRNVIRETLAYLAVAWVLLEVSTVVLDTFNAPDWISQTLIIILAIGLPIWVLISWAYKITLKGFERVSGPGGEIADKSSRKNLFITFVFAAIVAVGLIFAFRGIGLKIREDTQYAVAILPPRFIGENNFDWFSSGLASDIRNKISRVKNLSPTAMRSASRYQNSEKLITEIAEDLRVNYLLDGEIRMNGNLFLIDLQLVKENGDVVWSEQFMVPKGSHYQVSQKVIEQIIESLEVNVTKEEFGFFSREGTQDEKAWESFAKGEKLINNLHGLDLYRKASEHFKEAIRLDPEFAEAYAGLAVCQNFDAAWYADANKGLLKESVINAEKALQLDSTSALAHAVLGIYNWRWKRDSQKAREYYDTALDLDPNNVYILWDYAWALSAEWEYDLDRALSHINKAYQLDPFAEKVIWMKERIMWQSRDLKGLETYLESQNDTAFYWPIERLEGNLEVLRHRDARSRVTYYLDKINSDSLNPQLYWEIADVYWGLNRGDKWMEYKLKALEFAPNEKERIEAARRIREQLYQLGHFDKALELLGIDDPENIEEPERVLGWWYYYHKGDYERALSIMNGRTDEGMWNSYSKCLILTRMGRIDEVHEIIKRIHEDEIEVWDPRPLVQIYATLGERDSMYRWLNHPINIGFGGGHNGNPVFDPYRTEPRYRDWLRKHYLPQPEDTIVPE